MYCTRTKVSIVALDNQEAAATAADENDAFFTHEWTAKRPTRPAWATRVLAHEHTIEVAVFDNRSAFDASGLDRRAMSECERPS